MDSPTIYMSNLENILDITAAIRFQKENRKESLLRLVEDIFRREKSSLDIGNRVSDEKEDKQIFALKSDDKLSEKEDDLAYNSFKQFSEYISMIKDKLYRYSNIKNTFKEAMDNNSYKDKLLMEIEDWGVIYYKSTFRKLVRLTLIGYMARYLQKLWIYVSKNIN